MDFVNEEIISDLKKLNNNFREKFDNLGNLNKREIRINLRTYGKFVDLKKLNQDEIKNFSPMACVDGSVNRFGGSFPHYIDLFQGLSKVSDSKQRSFYTSKINSPLIEKIDIENEGEVRDKLLAKIEVEAALKTLEICDVKFILMDGNLIRYSILATEEFNKLKEICEKENIILSGFIKETKTDTLSELLLGKENLEIFDKDLLYGVLDEGEGFILYDDYSKKQERDISSMFVRTSNYPGVGGIEMLNSQREKILDVGNLTYSMTPRMSRGVPMIIDIVDSEVKLDDKLTEELILSYLDRDIVERIFVSERDLRRY